MAKKYTDEKNAQVVIALLKEHGIRKVIASPGTTNMAIVASMQCDSYFEMFSCVDERSAAYMACGLAAESGEVVVLSCTGATASRNYLPGLTEAYYRKLPVLAITSTQAINKIGQHEAQVIDRSSIQKDVAKISVTLPIVKDDDDLWDCEIKVNKAILELKRHGGGPVHINLPTTYSLSYNIKELPKFRVIERITYISAFPELPKGRIAIFVGSHSKMTIEQEEILDKFCASNDAVVFCDHTSNYKGKYRVLFSLVACQQKSDFNKIMPDLLIHIGEVSGDYSTLSIGGKEVWRVNEDGEIRDTFHKIRYIFEMNEETFFKYYSNEKTLKKSNYYEFCKNILNNYYEKIPELPFSNIWIASKIAKFLINDSVIYFGILNSLRSWNFFEIPRTVYSASNVGGFGIDGGLSSLVGASFANKNKLYYCVIGDLAFFYDMNVLGNRHVGNNLRIILVNNGKGIEFRRFNHQAAQFGEEADYFIAASGHFGNQSKTLVKHYAQDMGFKYLKASNKEEFETVYHEFLSSEFSEMPILFEVFTSSTDESNALEIISNLDENNIEKAKRFTKKIIGDNNLDIMRKIRKG